MPIARDPMLAAVVVAVLWQMTGHYLWMPPRHTLHKLEAYTWGVTGILLGLAVYGLLAHDWLPVVAAVIVSVPCGAITAAMWLTDSRGESGQTIEDLLARIADLERRLTDARHGRP